MPRGQYTRKPKGPTMSDQTQAASFTETPEFKEAVAKAAAEAAAAAVSQIMSKLEAGAKTAPAAGDEKSFLGSLALELAQLSGQGTGRRYVEPAILRQRELAREKLIGMLKAARANGTVITYELRNKVLLDDQLVEPMWIDPQHVTRRTQIDWGGIPNEAMIPVNEAAKEVFATFMESIGSTKKEIPDDIFGVTPKGLVVRNGAVNAAAARRAVGEGAAPAGEAPGHSEGLRVHHSTQPGRYVEKRILGTIADPALQSA